jgi:hypothetical protein
MPELDLLTAPDFSADLSARAGVMARAVAEVLEERCTPESGASDAARFLRDWAESAGMPSGASLGGPIDWLATRYSLEDDEVSLLLLAGLPEEHEGVSTTFRSLHPEGEPRPTVGLAALVQGGSPADRNRLRDLLASGSATRNRLLRVGGRGPLFERSLVLADELWSSLHGCDGWPVDLPRVRMSLSRTGLGAWLDRVDVQNCVSALRRDIRCLLLVPHEDVTVGVARCQALAAAAGQTVLGAGVRAGDSQAVALLAAHAAARGAVPLLVVSDLAEHGTEPVALGDVPGPVFVTAPPGAVLPCTDRAVLAVDSAPVPVAVQRSAWAEAVPGLSLHSSTLAARHPLDPAVTAQLALDLAATGRSDELTGSSDLAEVSQMVRARASVSLPSGAFLTTPSVDWSQLVLPEETAAMLQAAVRRLDQQATVLDDWGLRHTAQASRGVRMLFSGPPGTGKSLAAAALATAASTDLLVIDVSRIVSKWLGETEKNLAAAFEAAERTRAVLLLDEADALFGSRTEISDAHDRYANLETAYLLQRMERFDGLVVLTSNLRNNIDPAFTRRLDFVVEFPLPDLAGRKELWTRYLPPHVLDADVEVSSLAGLYAVPGGWIRNAAVAAAFEAAATGEPIDQERLVEAVRREYLKAATPFPGEPPRRRK